MRAGMEICRPRAGLLALTLALAVWAALAASLAPRSDASCKRVVLRVSKHTVSDDSWVRVRGRTCHAPSGGPHTVRIKSWRAGRWHTSARDRTRADGSFRGRVRVRAQGRRVVRLRATMRERRSKTVRLNVDSGRCALSGPTADIGMSLAGCRTLASDTAARPDPRSFWGNVECGQLGSPDPGRQQQVVSGGDTHSTASGAAQGNSSYRRLTVIDGDDYYGERCELGKNDYRSGPTAFYHEGQRRATFVSLRLPANFPLAANSWQTVLQMKQAQPADGGGDVPILYMGASRNQWRIDSINGIYWTFPAQPGVWTRFAFDVYYSQDPNRGWLQVSADLNGDGDFEDGGERSSVIRTNTLKTEVDGPMGTSDGLAAGDPIPSHLRTGVYHDPAIPCPAPGGCSVEVDNVQVLAP
jgi:hypothetical protein